jgi:hypothetical protein
VVVDDAPHAQEHCLEVQLPMLQQVLGEFTLVPILVGAASAQEVDALLARLWGGDETLIVISSDLSHYHDYAKTQQLDERARRAIEALQPEQLGEEQACGRHGLRGLLTRASALDLRATTLDLRNSGDTAGKTQRDRVVGYGGWSFEYAATARLSEPERAQLGELARKVISIGISHGRAPTVNWASFTRPLQALRATVVTELPSSGLRVEEYVFGKGRESGLDVTRSRRVVTGEGVAEVALRLDEKRALADADERRADRSVTMRVQRHRAPDYVGDLVKTSVIHVP